MIRFDDIYKTYNGIPIIKGVSGEIHTSKITAMIGPSGSGKSTLIRLLSYLEPPDEGIISNDSVDKQINAADDVSNQRINSIWPNLTVVFQQLFLWPHLNVYDNISLALVTSNNLTSNKIDEIISLLEYLELLNLKNRFPNELSTGQKQRVALIRALVLEPKYLLLDEITSSQDIEFIYKIKHLLIELKNKGTGILFATHLLGFAKDLADNIWFVNDGKIIEQGDSSILESPNSKRLSEFLKLTQNL